MFILNKNAFQQDAYPREYLSKGVYAQRAVYTLWTEIQTPPSRYMLGYTPCEQTDRCKNITYLQLRLGVVMIKTDKKGKKTLKFVHTAVIASTFHLLAKLLCTSFAHVIGIGFSRSCHS